jgi:hypothetical protein
MLRKRQWWQPLENFILEEPEEALWWKEEKSRIDEKIEESDEK